MFVSALQRKRKQKCCVPYDLHYIKIPAKRLEGIELCGYVWGIKLAHYLRKLVFMEQ